MDKQERVWRQHMRNIENRVREGTHTLQDLEIYQKYWVDLNGYENSKVEKLRRYYEVSRKQEAGKVEG